MHDTETVAVLRAVLHELCANLAPSDVSTRTRAAAKPLETAQHRPASIDRLKETGTAALRPPPTMWR
jgi:hypothetical protein